MNGLYHPRGFWRGLLQQPFWHVRKCLRNPAYRALHRFHRQLRRVPRCTVSQVVFAGRPIRICDGPSFLSAWDEIFVNRIYEVPDSGRAMPCLVDAGANIGLAALFWKWRYDRFRYLGFEPDPRIAACCRENLRAWRIEGELIEAAVAGREGVLGFEPDGADGGHLADGKSPLMVPAKRLSAYLPEEVDLLKIDVEGSEAEVVEEITPFLTRVRLLFVEWHGRSGHQVLGHTIARLESAGFTCYIQVAAGPRRPFLSPMPSAGFFQQINLYAVRS